MVVTLPARFSQVKQEIADLYPDFQEKATASWREIIEALNHYMASTEGQLESVDIPQVNFKDLENLDAETIAKIRRIGTVVIRDIVDDADATKWKEELAATVKTNPDVEGTPEGDKQFFALYWTKPQVQARSHPNLLAATRWLNQLYHLKSGLASALEGVDLSVPLTYADRFRIRHPGEGWDSFPPHVDGGSIERWEEPIFRKCFSDIFEGNWRKHDPYDLEGRLSARSSLYGRPNQSTVFRTFQGWLSMSETGPNEGTLRVFPDVLLSNAYIMLRPFFAPSVPWDSPDIYDPENWKFDISGPEFPGILPRDGGYYGPRPTPRMHPHLRLEQRMTSVPKVYPGDAVFWHCDVIHSVETAHHGLEDSAVMYIPAVPTTPMNLEYVGRQRDCFLNGERPPDFPKGQHERDWTGTADVGDVISLPGKIAMGLLV